jgi:hypothetical protein
LQVKPHTPAPVQFVVPLVTLGHAVSALHVPFAVHDSVLVPEHCA